MYIKIKQLIFQIESEVSNYEECIATCKRNYTMDNPEAQQYVDDFDLLIREKKIFIDRLEELLKT
jgi:hypothetical protein